MLHILSVAASFSGSELIPSNPPQFPPKQDWRPLLGLPVSLQAYALASLPMSCKELSVGKAKGWGAGRLLSCPPVLTTAPLPTLLCPAPLLGAANCAALSEAFDWALGNQLGRKLRGPFRAPGCSPALLRWGLLGVGTR